MTSSPITLARLISPGNVDDFFRGVWGRSVAEYPQGLGAAAGELLDLDGFERIVATLNRPHEGWLHLARGGLKPLPPEMVDEMGMVDLRKLRVAFSDGESLYLTKADRVSLPLMWLSRSIELELGARAVALRREVNAHVFLTPPRSQGFPAHRDEHASFVIQLEGSKEWTTYASDPGDGPAGAPAEVDRPGGVASEALRSMVARTHHLEAGDVLYLPEWVPHEARAAESHSLHVTVRIFPLRWVDLAQEAFVDSPALAGAIPPGLASRSGELADALAARLRSAAFREALDTRLEAAVRRRAIPRSALPGDGLRQALGLDAIRSDTLLVRSEGVACSVREEGGGAVIEFTGGGIRGPALIRPVFDMWPGRRRCDRATSRPSMPAVTTGSRSCGRWSATGSSGSPTTTRWPSPARGRRDDPAPGGGVPGAVDAPRPGRGDPLGPVPSARPAGRPRRPRPGTVVAIIDGSSSRSWPSAPGRSARRSPAASSSSGGRAWVPSGRPRCPG